MAREDIQKKWEERIAAFRSSGEKASRWCKANQVDRRGLYTWMKRLSASSNFYTPRKSGNSKQNMKNIVLDLPLTY
ncbi:IS66 family insertion sequence element accessory protein TnpA [Cohnella yongneupensis]|uniref:Helix-turn-helix domain-containing protein n=1 Tax=Cohnella yongneupensis TaxID=425006 RepID=A0ABW0QT08_9BACL